MIENNGKKIAAILGVASCFPVVATVYAMDQQNLPQPDTIKPFAQAEATLRNVVEEVGENFFIEESSSEQALTSDVILMNESLVMKEVQTHTESSIDQIRQIDEELSNSAVELDDSILDSPVVLPQEEMVETEISVEDTVYVDPIMTPSTPVYEEVFVEPIVEQQYIPQEPVVEEQYVEPEVVVPTNPYEYLNTNIASSAISLVGVTDGQWCTQVVQQALAGAGVQDAYQLWPDEYAPMYGYYTDTPEVGNLVYYYNGGRGVDHIAVYIGNGMAVHGNYGDGDEMGKTVIAPVIINGGAPQYIQVTR